MKFIIGVFLFFVSFPVSGQLTSGHRNRTGNAAVPKAVDAGVPASGKDYTETISGIDLKMVYVAGGDFVMGGTAEQTGEAESNEKTVRRVTLDSYYIGAFEVTQSQWEKVMKTNPSCFRKGADYPVEQVSWEDAQAFCEKLSRKTGKKYCLPTEAQWEYAARGGSKDEGTRYSGGDFLDTLAWYGDNSSQSTHPVGMKRPNALGLYDMSGNVWEWCNDWYGDYRPNDLQNPTGAFAGSYRVLRGGSWCYYAGRCRVSYRFNDYPNIRNNNYGFRVVCLP